MESNTKVTTTYKVKNKDNSVVCHFEIKKGALDYRKKNAKKVTSSIKLEQLSEIMDFLEEDDFNVLIEKLESDSSYHDLVKSIRYEDPDEIEALVRYSLQRDLDSTVVILKLFELIETDDIAEISDFINQYGIESVKEKLNELDDDFDDEMEEIDDFDEIDLEDELKLLKDIDFIDKISSDVENKSKKLSKIIKKKTEKKNIGGKTFNTQMLCQHLKGKKERYKYHSLESLGFKIIQGDSSLVNLALNDKIRIERVILNTEKSQKEESYNVNLTIKNISSKKIKFTIPKGQIFENKKPEKNTQNLASSKLTRKTIEANTSIKFDIISFCVNECFDPPDGCLGNITIYEIKDKQFENQNEIWKSIEGRNPFN